MMIETKTRFFDNYEIRYDILIGYQLILLFIYRLLTLFISTEGLHHIPFITPNQLQILFGIIELAFCILFLIKIPKNTPQQNVFLILLFVNVFFEVLYVEQFLIVTDPITFRENDSLLTLLQVLVLLVIILLSFQKSKFYFRNYLNYAKLYLLFAFVSLYLSSMLTSNPNYFLLFILLADVLFWIFLLTIIFYYSRILYRVSKRKAIIPLVVGFFLGFGMYMGMTQSQIMLAVITTIIDKTFSLHAIEPSIFGFNFRYLMIFLDVVLGFIFTCVLLVALMTKKEHRTEISSYFILGLTGLAVYPLLAIMRFIAFFKLVNLKTKEGNDILNDKSNIFDVITKLQPNSQISLAKIATAVQLTQQETETLLKEILMKNPSLGEYSETDQIFILKDVTEN